MEIKEFMTLISRNLFMKSQCRSNFVLRPKGPLSLSKFSIKNFVKENLDKVSVVTIKVFLSSLSKNWREML